MIANTITPTAIPICRFKDISAGITCTDGAVIRTDAERYKTSLETDGTQCTVRHRDVEGVLDQTWCIEKLDECCFTISLTVTNVGDAALSLARITVLEGAVAERHDPAKPHILLNGGSMSKPLPTVLEDGVADLESTETIALESPSLAAGFLTGKHNVNQFQITGFGGEAIVFHAFGGCDGCRLEPGASRETDMLFVSFHGNPLEQLERYADLAGKINNARIWPPRVAWCSWYAGWMHAKLATYRGGVEKGVEESIPLVRKYFVRRGGCHTMRLCDDYQTHGDWLNETGSFPHGFDRLAGLMAAEGVIPGVWYPTYWASIESKVFKEHPEWFALNEDGSTWVQESQKVPTPRPAAPTDGKKRPTTSPEASGTPWTMQALYNMPGRATFDTSRPDVQEYFENAARTWRERGFRYVTNDFLNAAMSVPRYQDPTLTKAEVLRLGLEAVRRGLGNEIFYRTISGPIGVRMGIADDLRISGDSHGDNPAAYYRTAQVWFYHRRLWLNDPSAVVCSLYGELRPIQWNRMWTSWIALSGTVMTYGEILDELPEEYISMYQRLFPPLPAAGRPLDIWENAPYMVWGMAPGEADGPLVLFGLFDVESEAPLRMTLNLDEIDVRTRGWEKPETVPQRYLLWDFWDEKLIVSDGAALEVDLEAKSGRIFALRADLGRPQLLGTNGHFSCGLIETGDIVWDAQTLTLSGKTKGNGGDPTTLFFHVPEGMRLAGAQLGATPCATRDPADSVLAVDVPATPEAFDFVLHFEGTPESVSRRSFVPGRAATRSGTEDRSQSAAIDRSRPQSTTPNIVS